MSLAADIGELSSGRYPFALYQLPTRAASCEKFCFSNHLFVDLETEPQILSRKLQNGNDIPKNIHTEINEIANQLTQPYKWEGSDLMMLDNKRFLHGRESFEMGDQRDIVSVQTEKASFPYDASWRRSRAL